MSRAGLNELSGEDEEDKDVRSKRKSSYKLKSENVLSIEAHR